MKSIVFTGGSCGAKTLIFECLKQLYPNFAFISETAVMIINGGFPITNESFPWTEKWQLLFEDTIFNLQKSMEDACIFASEVKDTKIMICDRGLLDIAAHLPGGMSQFCKRYKVTEQEILNRYDVVIHLTSLAVIDPVEYQKIASLRWGNSYFGSLEHTIQIEKSILEIYENHPNRFIINGDGDVEKKKAEVFEIIRNI